MRGLLLTASLAVALACGDGTGPVVTSIKIDPLELHLQVGDTGLLNVVLLADGDTVGVDAPKEGATTVCYSPLFGEFGSCGSVWAGRATAIAGYRYTRTVATVLVEAVAPGVDTLWVHYWKWSACTDPPLCYSRHEQDIMPPQSALISVE
jgi:hypothetical protein